MCSHTMNVLLFKFRCNIFIGVRIIKEMPGLVASGTHFIFMCMFQSPQELQTEEEPDVINLEVNKYSQFHVFKS